jgi:hypothetical protein
MRGELKNVIDACYGDRKFSFNGHDLIFVPGSSVFTKGFKVSTEAETGDHDFRGGTIYIFNPNDLDRLVGNPRKATVFAHHPCRIEGNYSIDLAVHAKVPRERHPIVGPYAHNLIRTGQATPVLSHEGDPILTRVLRETGVKKFLSGDIHEAASIVDFDGLPVSEGERSRQVFANPGPAKEGDYGVLTLYDDGTASVTRHNVTGKKRDYLFELTG